MALSRSDRGGPTNKTATGTLTAAGQTVQLAVEGMNTATIVLSGTWVASVVLEISADGGSTWGSTDSFDITSGDWSTLPKSDNETYFLNTIGAVTHVRARCSAYTSGTVSVSILGSATQPLLWPAVSKDINSGASMVVVGGLDPLGAGGDPTAFQVRSAVPGSDDPGLVTRNIPSGTQTVSGTVTANQGTAGTAWEVVGDVAQDAAIAGNPLPTGFRASTAVPAAMSADGDSVYGWANRSGAPVVTAAPHVGLNSDPWNLVHEAAQYTTTQTSTVLVAGGASEKIVVTKVQIQVGGTTAGTLQLYFGTGAYSRGTNRAIFDGEFAPSATLKPGVVMDGPFIAGTNGDDLMVTTSAAINPLTISVWYYVVV